MRTCARGFVGIKIMSTSRAPTSSCRFHKVLRFHASTTSRVRRLQADSASSRITVSDCKSISHFVGMSRDVAFVMQFRDRECRRVRVAESRGYTRKVTYVCAPVHTPDIFMRAHMCLYRSTVLRICERIDRRGKLAGVDLAPGFQRKLERTWSNRITLGAP